jgi:hypothetical protein
MDSLKFPLGLPCPTFLYPAGGSLPKWPYSYFRGGPSARQAACGHLLPLWTPHTVRLWAKLHLTNRLPGGDLKVQVSIIRTVQGQHRRETRSHLSFCEPQNDVMFSISATYQLPTRSRTLQNAATEFQKKRPVEVKKHILQKWPAEAHSVGLPRG